MSFRLERSKQFERHISLKYLNLVLALLSASNLSPPEATEREIEWQTTLPS